MRCTARSCKVSLTHGGPSIVASTYKMPCESGSTEHVVSLGVCDWLTNAVPECRRFSCRSARHVPRLQQIVADAGKPRTHLMCQVHRGAWAAVLLRISGVFAQAVRAAYAAFKWSGFAMIPMSSLLSFHEMCLQAFCKDVLQQPAEEMPCNLRERALPRIAMRSYWLQAYGHRITPKMKFAMYSQADFAERYGSTEEAIEEWRQHCLHSPEGRLYGGDSKDAGVDRWAPQNLCTSATAGYQDTIHASSSCCVGPWLAA